MLVEVVLLGLLLLLLKQVFKKPDGLPPGKWGLPLFGHVKFFSAKNTLQHLDDLQKEHGDIYVWRKGTQVIIYLHDYNLVKEAFNKPEFSDRPQWYFFCINETPSLGIAGPNGLRWHNNRRFSLRQLRDQGMGKSKLVCAVHTQAQSLVEVMKKQANKIAPVPDQLSIAVVNIIWHMVGSRQFEMTDPRMKRFDDLLDEFMVASPRMFILDFMPWIHNVLPKPILDKLFNLDVVEHVKNKFVDYFQSVIDEHKEGLDRDNPQDLIDNYLIEIEERKADEESPWHDRDLAILLWDLFTAGSLTTVHTLTFMFYYVANNMKAQQKLQHEIDIQLNGALPTLEDRPRMPYTEAVIHETLRMSSLVAAGLEHSVSADTHLAGYKIPKGSVVCPAISSIHHDPRYWKDPHQFRPERWLDQDGHFNSKREGFLPFSIGKRNCVGEGLARMELFIFVSVIFQSITFNCPPGKTVNPNPDPDIPVFNSPIKQDVLITVR